jgi:quercetin dioxygenase-like cupin family protein
MKQSYTWANGELNALILLKSPEKQIVLTAIHGGTEIKSFQANGSVTFQIIEGKLRFRIRKDTVTLNEGQLMTLDEKTRYRLTTDQETVFLLTISNTGKKSTGN